MAKKASKKASNKTSVKKLTKASKAKKPYPRRVPQTMEELLSKTGYELRGLKRGDLIEGLVTEVGRRAVFIDVGGKTEGMVVDREIDYARDLIEKLSPGDRVLAYVAQPENEAGQLLLSLRKAAADRRWDKFEKALASGESVKVSGRELNRGGMIVDASGLSGFIPGSQFGSAHLGKLDKLIGQELEVKPIEVDRQNNRLILSEKTVSEAGEIARQAKALTQVKVGKELAGLVSGVLPFGLFVRVEIGTGAHKTQFEGLVHISEISWERVEDPTTLFSEGDAVKVKVLSVDEQAGKLNLSLRQLTPDPWVEVPKRYPADQKVTGTVSRLSPFGAFVTLEPGVEGLVHVSKIPADQEFRVGDKISCFVESVDPETRRLSLGLVLKGKPVGYK